MEDVSKRIKKKRKLLGLTQLALADKLCVRPQTVSGWERALTTPSGQLLGELSKCLGVSPSWLLYGEDVKEKEKCCNSYQISKSNELVCFIKLLEDVRASAGGGYENSEWSDVEMYPIPSEVLNLESNKNEVFAIRAHGNSMEPVFFDGAVLAVNPKKNRIIDGRIFVIRSHDGYRVKVLKESHKGVLLESFNSDYQDELISWSECEDLEIVGEVFWFSSKVSN
ncbi:XRE family transcriptional regulator [Vibrio scophthalmi]|uniref:Putative phage repressor n=1 Tax=Vibrio scophthalmi LMG 19158 TaxID=870967 RepID=F9RID2_9VIBR|nr:S24 family peptidase [Vibrio scophthalmi]EGU42464.1 putative phage repressor [Vibrio scophthalmi LMG 19158]